MKTNTLFLFFSCIFFSAYSQEKFKISSIDIPKIGIFSSTRELPISTAGLTTGFEIAASYKKDLIALEFEVSEGLNLVSDYNIYQYNFTLGRNLRISKSLLLQPSVGLGLFREKYRVGSIDFKYGTSELGEYITSRTLGIPVKLKLLIEATSFMTLGFAPSVNINPIATSYFSSISIHWHFKEIE